MHPAEDDFQRLVFLRVKKRVLDWLTAENDFLMRYCEQFNESTDWWNEAFAGKTYLGTTFTILDRLDCSLLKVRDEVLDWLYAECLYELLFLEETLKITSYPFNPVSWADSITYEDWTTLLK